MNIHIDDIDRDDSFDEIRRKVNKNFEEIKDALEKLEDAIK